MRLPPGAPGGGPPVVRRTEPVNGPHRRQLSWPKEPRIGIAFDQAMDPQGLANPDAWLRAWVFRGNADQQLGDGRRLKLAAGEPPEGKRITFRAEAMDTGRLTVVVLMVGSPEIVSADTGLALDAEFRGTQLTQDQLDVPGPPDGFAPDPAFAAGLRDGGSALPSGDRSPGGKYFHAFFTVAQP